MGLEGEEQRRADRCRLAVCVPTHDGRAGAIDELLGRLAEESQMHDVEVCISDNGSTDGTEQVVAGHRESFGERLRYSRNPRNLGMAENVLRAVAMASADYCWLMGSDDAPAPGAIARVRELLSEHAGTSGLALGFMRVSREDLSRPAPVVGPEPFPPQRVLTRLRGRLEVAETVGYVTYFTSCNVVHRGRWQAVAEADRADALRAGSGPHLYVTARMAALHPDWVWCPEPLVLSRAAALYLADADELGEDSTAIVRRIFADHDWIWARVHGRYSYLHRALMYRSMSNGWGREALLYQRIHSHGPREMLANLLCARRFWWSRRFWRHHFPLLVMPLAPLRAPTRRWRGLRTREIPEDDRRVSLRGAVPDVISCGYSVRVTTSVRNDGPRALSSALPYPTMLSADWTDAESGLAAADAPTHATLWPPLRAGAVRRIELLVAAPSRPGEYRLRIRAVQPGVAWFDAGADSAIEGTVCVAAVAQPSSASPRRGQPAPQ